MKWTVCFKVSLRMLRLDCSIIILCTFGILFICIGTHGKYFAIYAGYLFFSNSRSPIIFIDKICILDQIPSLHLVYKRKIQLLLIQINICGKCLRFYNVKRLTFTYGKTGFIALKVYLAC